MARAVKDIAFQGSLMVVDIVYGSPFKVKEGTQLLDGSNAVVTRGWKQTAQITYYWANAYEKDNLQDLPQFGLDTLLNEDEGWVYDEPQISEIEATIHYFNITVNAFRYTKTKPAI